MEEHKDRMPWGRMFLMLCTAVIFDIIGLVPGVGEITSSVGSATVFGIWFLSVGISLISPRKVASWGIPLFAEMIPGLSEFLPGVTIGIILMIIITKAEDKLGLQLVSRKGFANPATLVAQLKNRNDNGTQEPAQESEPEQEPVVVAESPMIDMRTGDIRMTPEQRARVGVPPIYQAQVLEEGIDESYQQPPTMNDVRTSQRANSPMYHQ